MQYAMVAAAFVVLVIGAIRKDAAPRGELSGFLVLTMALVLANAFLCGPISGPYARYQARVEWLVPLAAMFLVAQWVGDALAAKHHA